MKNLINKFSRIKKAILPTPVYKLKPICDKYNHNVYIKRDDLTGFAFGGNKARKLEYLLADAQSQNCDTLIATGANQSNFCRMVTAFGVSNNMDVHLVLGGIKPEIPTGNLRLDHILGANIHHINSTNWNDWELKAEKLAKQLTNTGKKVYRMPVGGSTPIGALGYVKAVEEILKDEKLLGINFDYVLFASSSAGTQSGLIVGKEIYNFKGDIIGITVAKNKTEFESEIIKLANETAKCFQFQINEENVIVDDSFIGDSYAAKTKECIEAVNYFAKKCGIFLDYVYSGKAAAGLINYLQNEKFKKKSNILFLHTGGNVELFE